MADAPKTESSSSWGAFEIGLVVLIVVALLSKNTISDSPKTTDTTTDSVQEEYFCGLQVTSPAKNALVGNTFTLRGVTEGCYWDIREGTVLSYQVLNSQGTPVSDFKTITRSSDAFPYVFEETITLTEPPKTSTGFVLLIAPSPDSNNQTVSVRIPIRFQK